MTTAEKLVPQVKRIASGFYPNVYRTCDREDMVQEGFVGLMEARERYDPHKGASKSTWCSLRARGAMHDHVRTMARKSREMNTGAIHIFTAADSFRETRVRSPESEEVLIRFRRYLRSSWSRLERPLGDVIRMRFIKGLSIRETAKMLSCSAATVVRRERRALARLREGFEACGYGRDL